MRAFVLVAALAAASLLSSTAVLAQAPQVPASGGAQPARLPDARTIIDRHVEAIGGRKAILAHSSTRATGTASAPAQGMYGTFELMAARPNLMLQRITIGGIGDLADGFDGTNAWSMSPITGPALAQGKELEQKRFDADFYGELHDPARYESVRTVERTTFDGRPCYKVSLVAKGVGEDIEFYDIATGLKAGRIVTRETLMGTITATETRGEYKKFGDMLQPITIRESTMGIEQALNFTSFEYDTVDAATFNPPAEIKALVK